MYPYICSISLQVENELEDLIDELLERDGGSGNSTIIGESPRTEYSLFLCLSLSWEDPFSHHLLAQLCLRAHSQPRLLLVLMLVVLTEEKFTSCLQACGRSELLPVLGGGGVTISIDDNIRHIKRVFIHGGLAEAVG